MNAKISLNPNDLRAVIVIVILNSTGQCVLKDDANFAASSSSSVPSSSYIHNICVPDEDSVLGKVSHCVNDDDMWYVAGRKVIGSVGLSKCGIYVLHPAVLLVSNVLSN